MGKMKNSRAGISGGMVRTHRTAPSDAVTGGTRGKNGWQAGRVRILSEVRTVPAEAGKNERRRGDILARIRRARERLTEIREAKD